MKKRDCLTILVALIGFAGVVIAALIQSYLGRPQNTPTPEPVEILLDFESGADGLNLGLCNRDWTIESFMDSQVLRLDSLSDNQWKCVYVEQVELANYELELDIWLDEYVDRQETSGVLLLAWHRNDAGQYLAAYDPKDSVMRVWLDVPDQNWQPLTDYFALELVPQTWNHFSLNVVGTQMSLSLNGNHLFSITDETLTSGRFGIRIAEDMRIYVDNIRIRLLNS